MLLHLTLVSAPDVSSPHPAAAVELVVDTSIVDSARALQAMLVQSYTNAHCSVGGEPLESLTLGLAPLVNGAVIVAGGGPGVRSRPARLPNLVLVVCSGPDSGQLVALKRGTYSLGRTGTDIVLDDPEVSRIHAFLTVETNQVTLHDNAAANGTWVDGARIIDAPISVTSDLRFGGSRCRLVLLDQHTTRGKVPDLTEPLEVRSAAPPRNTSLMLATATVPLILGIVLAVTTGFWVFLGFSVLSAGAGLVPLVAGRRARKVFTAALSVAAQEDRRRRLSAAPDVGSLAVAAYSAAPTETTEPGVPPTGPVYVRLGVGSQLAHLTVKPPGAPWSCPLLDDVPLTVELTPRPANPTPPEICISGSGPELLGMARSLLLQLSHHPGTAVCAGAPDDLAADARFLPGVVMVSTLDALENLLRTAGLVPVLVFGPFVAVSVQQASCLFRFGHTSGTELPRTPKPARGTVTLRGGQAERSAAGEVDTFRPDLVSSRSFGRLARALGSQAPPEPGDDRQTRCHTPGLPPCTSLARFAPSTPGQVRRAWGDPPPGLAAPIGLTSDGIAAFDLVSDGPHLVVAGTTGSGKSEILRTLVLSIALHHSPCQVNFLLIDFKGGAGLSPLSALPHTVGVLTDLSTAAVDRALVSLLAELRRRERLFATHLVTDIAEWAAPHRPALPRLVVVIDEFRMLMEDVPNAPGELMRLATVGRSLGVHLVMSTQRPQGALGPDIRANVTASIALRVSSPLDSQDILGSSAAASIPVGLPGRAFLRVGTSPPVAFQSASTGPDVEAADPEAGVVELNAHLLHREVQSTVHPLPQDVSSPLLGLVAATVDAADTLELEPLHRPVLPCLPSALEVSTDNPAPDGTIELGLLDIPDEQAQRQLNWSPGIDSHLALIGQPIGGTAGALIHLVAQHLGRLPDRHLYLLDGDGSLRWAAPAPQVGSYVSAHELKRAARVVHRLAALVTERLSDGTNFSGSHTTDPGETLVVSGWGRWMGELRSSRWSWAEELLQDLARDGALAGTTLVVSGHRELVTGRLFPLLPNRLYFPLGATGESTLSWPKVPPTESVPGRCLAQGPIATGTGVLGQVILGESQTAGPTVASVVGPSRAPLRILALPAVVHASETNLASSPGPRHRIPLGVGGDEPGVVFLELTRRLAFLVIGSRGTGRSTLLKHISAAAPRSIVCVQPGPGSDPVLFWKDSAQNLTSSGIAAADSLLLVDDADELEPETHRQLGQLFAEGYRMILTVTDGGSMLARVPLAAHARSARTGLVLGPRQPSDGDFFGVRLDCDARPRAGRGFLFLGGEPLEVQLALPVPDATDGGGAINAVSGP